jgi:hypothetical protein
MFTAHRIWVTIWVVALSVLRRASSPKAAFCNPGFDPFIEYLEVGEGKEMRGGPALVKGWYLHPSCMIGCCNSEGPFMEREEAVKVDRLYWTEIKRELEDKRKLNKEESLIEPF